MANYKTSHKAYAAWNYQQEIEDLNAASEQGWQLVKGGCFSSRFVENPGIRYRYQIDFGKIEDMGRYIETYREQGWEYVNSTFNGWHYFRKLYDPSQPDEAYEIFTDTESLHEMQSRWAKIALGVGIALFIFAIIYAVRLFRQFNIPNLITVLLFLIESSVLTRGANIMRDPSSSKSRKGSNTFLSVFLAVIIIGAAAMITFTALRPHMQASQISESILKPIAAEEWSGFEIKYTDFYNIDLEMKSDKPMLFEIVKDDGTVVYENAAEEFTGKNIPVRLKPGHYAFRLSAESGFKIDCSVK